jgi:glycosyltransferase involved in cell wall biosynthesis
VTASGDHPEHPTITIGISTYNRVAGTFPAALRSALDQDYPGLDVVVCDNASDDGTHAFMQDQHDPSLRYVRHPTNIGANANFNACLEHAQGDYFLLLHDDDLLEPGFAQRAAQAIGAERPGVALGGTRIIDGSGATTSTVNAPPPGLTGAGLFEAWFARRTSFYFCSTLFHTSRLRNHGGFASPEDLFQDVVAIARLAAEAGYASVPGITGSFRRHDANRGGASHALRWTRDAEHLLDLLRTLFPDDAHTLTTLGQPYLATKCYRYVESVPSPLERWRLYRDIDRRFEHTLSPWTYLLQQHVKRFRRRLGRAHRNLLGHGSTST